MISVMVSLPEEDPGSIRRFREQIWVCAGGDRSEADVEARPCSLYLFALAGGGSQPIGMLEFCFVGHPSRFRGGSNTGDLAAGVAQFCPVDEVLHVGSLAVEEERKNSRVVTALCQGFLECAARLDVRGFTASSAVINTRSERFQRGLGMTKFLTYRAGDVEVEASFYDLTFAVRRAARWDRHKPKISLSEGFQRLRSEQFGGDDRLLTDSEEFRLVRRLAAKFN